MDTSELKQVDIRTLKIMRRASKITQQALASAIGVSVRKYQMIESGENDDPGIKTMSRICDYIGIQFEQIVLEDRPELPGPPEPPGS